MSNTDDLYAKILKALKEQTDELKRDIQKIHQQVTEEGKNTREKLKNIENRQNEIKEKIVQLERVTRKNNIIIFGLEVEKQELIPYVLNQLNALLGLNLTEGDINNIYKLNKKNNSPIKIEFISYLKKKTVFASINKLKGKNIYINNDLRKEDQETNRILRIHQKQAKQKGYKAYIKGGKVIINNETYSIEQLEQADQLTTPSSPEVITIRPSTSAPATPTPISRNKEIESQYIAHEHPSPPKISVTKDKLPQKTNEIKPSPKETRSISTSRRLKNIEKKESSIERKKN